MDTTKTIVLTLAIGIPLVFLGTLFYHGETAGVKQPLSQTGLPSYNNQLGGKSKGKKHRRHTNKTRKH